MSFSPRESGRKGFICITFTERIIQLVFNINFFYVGIVLMSDGLLIQEGSFIKATEGIS